MNQELRVYKISAVRIDRMAVVRLIETGDPPAEVRQLRDPRDRRDEAPEVARIRELFAWIISDPSKERKRFQMVNSYLSISAAIKGMIRSNVGLVL